MKKKIGIITFQNAYNYGATLQCIALQETLKNINKNNEVYVIDYRNQTIDNSYKAFSFNSGNIFKSIVKGLIFLPQTIKRNKKYSKFLKEKLNLTKECHNKKEVEEITKSFDVLISGSDQVWNGEATGGIDPIYFLNFKTDAKKISYAASLGSNKMEDKEYFYKLLSPFDSISVREKDGCEIVEKICGKKVENVLDPTLIIDSNYWLQFVNNNIQYSNYIFSYSPNKSVKFPELVNYVSNTNNNKVINVYRDNIGYKNILKNANTSDPYEFLNLIYNSNIVITTSFHATVFSIIFKKNFWVLSPSNNKSRIYTLLSLLGIEERSLDSIETLKSKDINEKIDYETVEKRLEELKKDSINWLKENL